MMADLTIRRAAPSDAEALTELSVSTFRDAFLGTTSDQNLEEYIGSALSLEAVSRELNDPRCRFFVVESGRQMIAYLKLVEDTPPEEVSAPRAIEVARIYVRSEYLAQKLGSILMETALEEGRSLGYSIIHLGVWEHNERAKRFYDKWGFVKVGEHVFQMGNDRQTDWRMERAI